MAANHTVSIEINHGVRAYFEMSQDEKRFL